MLPKDFPTYFPGLDVVSSRRYSIKSKEKEELAKYSKWADLEHEIFKQHEEHIRMEESIRSLEEKIVKDRDNFIKWLKISAEKINLLNTRLQTMIIAKDEENSINEDQNHLKNNNQCSIF